MSAGSDAALAWSGLLVGQGRSFRRRVPDERLRAGERLAVIGPSGSGKTTLLRALAGLQAPLEGRVEALGRALTGLSAGELRAFRRRHLGLVFQTFALLDHLSVAQNLLLVHHVGAPAPRAEARLEELARRLGLSDLLRRKPARLSHGERQRVAIGRALLTRPELVLADEPTGNLDPRTKQSTLELLLEACAEDGAALVMVTHDHSLLAPFDRVLDLGAVEAAS